MAKRFRFRLEVVRKLREQARDAQRRVVAEVVRAISAVEGRIDGLTRELRDTVHQTRDARQVARVDVTSLRTHQYYQSWLHRKIMETGLELDEKRRQLDVERARLGDASARLKAIEKLRERRWQRHSFELKREEQAETNESALHQYERNSGRHAARGRRRGGESGEPDGSRRRDSVRAEVQR